MQVTSQPFGSHKPKRQMFFFLLIMDSMLCMRACFSSSTKRIPPLSPAYLRTVHKQAKEENNNVIFIHHRQQQQTSVGLKR